MWKSSAAQFRSVIVRCIDVNVFSANRTTSHYVGRSRSYQQVRVNIAILGLLQQPRITGRVAYGRKDHGRRMLARAVKVQSESPDVDGLSDSWRQLAGLGGSTDLFIGKAS